MNGYLNRRFSSKNSILINKNNNTEYISRKNSNNNNDGYYKSDDNVAFSESEDFDGRDSFSNGANIKKRITLSKSNTLKNQNMNNNLGKGSFLYQNANTINDFDGRRPSFLDENYTHKVFKRYYLSYYLLKNLIFSMMELNLLKI